MANTMHFFLGANSGHGFCNLFDRFCMPENHQDLIILKGGPGCGKSTMMKKIGKAMEEEGEQVEYLYCSGDPNSLDGVHIPRIGAAIVDGTSPHVVEPKYPAAVDRYVNLGQFYDISAAKKEREEVIRQSKACSEAYQCAYRALGAARQIEESAAYIVREGFDMDKLQRRADGIIGREIRGKGSGGPDLYRFLGSITCKGKLWRFDTIEANCQKIYQLQDTYGLASPMLERIHAAAKARNYQSIICPDAEHLERIQHLILPELELAFVTSRDGMLYGGPAYRRIRVDAMVPSAYYKRYKARLRFSRKMTESLQEEGIAALQEAKKHHDELEAVYQPHVDFAGVDALTEQELTRLKSYL